MQAPRRPRIAVVTHLPGIRDAALYAAAARKDVDVLVVVPDAGPAGVWPADVRRAPVAVRGRSLTRSWVRELGATLRGFDADLVHVHNEPWAITTQRLAMSDIPAIVHGGENLYRHAPLAYRIRRFNTRFVLRRVAGYLSWGVTGLTEAQNSGLPSSTPQAVIPASPPSETVFSRVRLPQPAEAFEVVFVGRLVPEKGVDTLLRALAQPHRRGRMRVTVAGDGPECGRLRALARSLGVDARFLGRLDAAQAHAAMAAGHVVVVPSRSVATWKEQWGRTAVEAMMTGRPVLVSDSGELPHVVQDPAWVFPQGDADSLGRALDELRADPQLLQERGDSAYARSLGFRPDVLADQLVDFWGEVLQRRGTSPR